MTRSRKRKLIFAQVMILMLMIVFSVKASADSLTTFYGADSNYPGFMFDLEVLGDQDIVIESFDVNVTDAAAPSVIQLYIREGSYRGYESTTDGWTLAGSAEVTAMGKNAVTPLSIGNIQLTAGKTYGLYMTTEDQTLRFRYTYTELPSEQVFQNETLRLSGGTAVGVFVLYPRIWNGTIYYSIVSEVPQTGDSAGALAGFWMMTAITALVSALYLYRKAVR